MIHREEASKLQDLAFATKSDKVEPDEQVE